MKEQSNWRVPVLLLMLGSVSILFGMFQAFNIIVLGPPKEIDEFTSMHYHTMPIPILLHVIFGVLFNLLAPFQFVHSLRRRFPRFHRYSGRLLIPTGVIAAVSALWMNEFYPSFGGEVKYYAVIIHSILLIAFLGLAVSYILKRKIPQHRAWMMRAVAVSLSPATQRVIMLPIFGIFGIPEQLDVIVGVLIWSALFLNLAVVEWVLRRGRNKVCKNGLAHPVILANVYEKN